MKKVIAILLSLLIALSLFGCAMSSPAVESDSAEKSGSSDNSSAIAPGYNYGDADYILAPPIEESKPDGSSTETAEQTTKIVYTGYATIETREFDKAVAAFKALVTQYGGYIENSSVSGLPEATYLDEYGNYYRSYNPMRSAYFTVRIPADQFDAIKNSVGTVGSVISQSESAANITDSYYDVQARINSLEAQEASLLAMLEKAEDVSTMLTVTSYLSDVQYQLDNYRSQLQRMDKQVAYSTLTVTINEVETLTPTVKEKRTYWQQIGDGFVSTLKGIGDFFAAVFKGIIVSLPAFITVGVIVVIVLVIVFKSIKKRKANKKDVKELNQ